MLSKKEKSKKLDAQYINDTSDHDYEAVITETKVPVISIHTTGASSLPRTDSNVDTNFTDATRRFAPEESTLESLNLEPSESVTWRKVIYINYLDQSILYM